MPSSAQALTRATPASVSPGPMSGRGGHDELDAGGEVVGAAPDRAERAQAHRVPGGQRFEAGVDRLGALEVEDGDRRRALGERRVDVGDPARDGQLAGPLEREEAPRRGSASARRGLVGDRLGERFGEDAAGASSTEPKTIVGVLPGRGGEHREDAAAHPARAHPRQVEVAVLAPGGEPRVVLLVRASLCPSKTEIMRPRLGDAPEWRRADRRQRGPRPLVRRRRRPLPAGTAGLAGGDDRVAARAGAAGGARPRRRDRQADRGAARRRALGDRARAAAGDAARSSPAVDAPRRRRDDAIDGRAEEMPLADRSVDAVVAGSAFHWFDREPTLDEIARVLRPPGVFGLLGNRFDTSVDWQRRLRGISGGGDLPGRPLADAAGTARALRRGRRRARLPPADRGRPGDAEGLPRLAQPGGDDGRTPSAPSTSAGVDEIWDYRARPRRPRAATLAGGPRPPQPRPRSALTRLRQKPADSAGKCELTGARPRCVRGNPR